MRTRKARPERFRISFRDEAGGTPLPLRSRRMWPVGLFLGVAFLIFGGIAWSQITSMRGHEIKSVFDLTFILFQGFWVLGWSVGVVILGALTVLFLFYEESARLRDGHLIHTPRLGPLRISVEYQLAKIRNLRLERAGGHAGQGVQIRFDYGGGSNSLGNVMPRPEAETLIALIREATSRAPSVEAEEIASPPVPRPSSSAMESRFSRTTWAGASTSVWI